ncbi:MAG: hypothetical protein ACKVYV_03300, partial [Limisphaerales bacterium]
GGVAQRTATHAYDTAGRLGGVTADTGAAATYGYLPKSPLWQTLTFKQGATNRLTTTRAFDRLNRLQSIANVAGGASSASPLGVNYLYNDANQRVRATDADGNHWVYEYDALGQFKGGRKYWSDGTPVAGQQFTYAHDDIGNRTASYTRNRLNQYTARTVPTLADGLATLDAMAARVRAETERHRGRFRARPEKFERSEGFFRLLMLAVMLAEDFGVAYHRGLRLAPGTAGWRDGFFREARHVLLPGLLAAEGMVPGRAGSPRRGTCSSLPVLYVAVGRRLGYPLRLVATRSHLFVRWDGMGERFNVDASGGSWRRCGSPPSRRVRP